MLKRDNFDNLLSYAYVAREISRGSVDFKDLIAQQNEIFSDIPDYDSACVYYYFIRLIRDYMHDEYEAYKIAVGSMIILLRNSYSKHLGQLADLTGVVYNTFGLPIYDTGKMSDIETVPEDYIVVIKSIAEDIVKNCEALGYFAILDKATMLMADLIILWKKYGHKGIVFRAAKIRIFSTCSSILSDVDKGIKKLGVDNLTDYYNDTKILYNGLVDSKVTEYYDFMYILMGVPEQLIPPTLGEGYIP